MKPNDLPFAVEPVRPVLEFAEDSVHLERVAVNVDPKDQASIGVLEKAGFKFEKMLQLRQTSLKSGCSRLKYN